MESWLSNTYRIRGTIHLLVFRNKFLSIIKSQEKGVSDVTDIPDINSATLFRYGNCL